MERSRTPLLILVAALAAVLLPRAFADAASGTPALSAFDDAFAKTTSFTYKLHSHEVNNSGDVQDRVYDYSFMKPHFAKTLIESGPGKGSGAVWAGGDQVSGHQGGFLSGIHLKVGLHDARAVSIRGYTMPDGLPQNIVQRYTSVKGELSQTSDAGMIEGAQTDLLTLKVADACKQRRHFVAETVSLATITLPRASGALRRRQSRSRPVVHRLEPEREPFGKRLPVLGLCHMSTSACDVNNRFVILSRKMAQTVRIPGRYAVISINDNRESPQDTLAEICKVKRGYVDILQIIFDDLTPESHDPATFPHHVVMTDAMADEVVRFWNRWRHDVDRFMIHCTAGISRSSGVGSALARLEGDREAEAACYAGTMPNMYVRRLIERAAARLQVGPYA